MPDLTELACLVDQLLDDDAVVFGSSPRDARDLDILCDGPAAQALGARLGQAGFQSRGDTWLRIHDGRCWVVDLTRADGPGMPHDLAAAVRRDSLALPAHAHLRRPAPHHALLLLAWRLHPARGGLQAKHSHRIRQVLAENIAAWERAEAEAGSLGLTAPLADLRAAFEGAPVDRPERGSAARLRDVAGRALGRRSRGGVVAVSGVDGAGKSTQTRVLAEALDALGYTTDVKWTRITYDPALERIARPVKAALSLAQRRRDGLPSEPGDPAGDGERAAPDQDAEPLFDERGNEVKTYVPHPGTPVARSLRQRSRLIAGAWATVIAFADARALRRTTLPLARRGTVVIRDRYALDSVVQLLDQYGPRHRLQSRIIARLAPHPLRAFLLDVPAITAWNRKPEEYDVEQLERHRQSYLARAEQLGVAVVDADRDADEISTELVMQVWDALR